MPALSTGDILSNGARIIAHTEHSRTGETVLVAAHWPDNYHQFATWKVDGAEPFDGHYFHSAEEAIADLRERRA